MFKAIKDFKRRSVETLHGALGSTERTVDEEFDAQATRFQKMMGDMNECTSESALLTFFIDERKHTHTHINTHTQPRRWGCFE